MNVRRKKALVVLYSPKTLNDFLWYYSQMKEEYEWTVLLQCYGGRIAIEELCKKAGIFDKSICDNGRFDTMSLGSKMKMFLRMGIYYLCHRQTKIAEEILEEKVGKVNFDLIVVAPSETLVQGMCICMAKKIPVTILEDGLNDYIEHSKRFQFSRGLNFNNILGYLLAKMGYANTSMAYWMENNSLCTKCCCYPERMKNKGYKSIVKLYDEKADDAEYRDLVEKTFEFRLQEVEDSVILYTTPLDDFTEGDDRELIDGLVNKTVTYIENYGKRVYLKRHPRDTQKYNFNKQDNVIEINKLLPAEFIISLFRKQENVFMYPSTVLMAYDNNFERVQTLYYKDLEHKSQKLEYGFCFEQTVAAFPGIHVTEI